MKRPLEKRTEKDLLEGSHRVMFELLDLHDREMDDYKTILAATKKDLQAKHEQVLSLERLLEDVYHSKSFRVGYIILHPFSAMKRLLLRASRLFGRTTE